MRVPVEEQPRPPRHRRYKRFPVVGETAIECRCELGHDHHDPSGDGIVARLRASRALWRRLRA